MEHARASTRMVNRHGCPLRGVTLVEVLVVMGVISTLTGVAIPVLGGAREAARQAACGVTQRNLYSGMFQHTQDNNNAIPGVNTTGRRFLSVHAKLLLGDTKPDTPTTTFDWMSPIFGITDDLSSNRARRTQQLFTRFACPSATEQVDSLWGYAPDREFDFEPLLRDEGFRQISYLSPAAFHLAGRDYLVHKYKTWRWLGPAIPPNRYLPRLDRVGALPARKIFVADGTRYLASDGTLDFDISPDPKYFGSFTSSSPIYTASTAYGDKPNTAQFAGESGGSRGAVSKRNKELSYRHAGAINVCYFDGHIGAMDETESKTDASVWYPSGSFFTGFRATQQSLRNHELESYLD